MKQKFLLLAFVAMLTGVLTSCNKDGDLGNYPILYVVNGTDYSVNVYCDNRLVTSAGAHNNSGKVELSNTSVNLPVYVEAEFYDTKGKRIGAYIWDNYYFQWNKLYKMTLTKSSSTSMITAL